MPEQEPVGVAGRVPPLAGGQADPTAPRAAAADAGFGVACVSTVVAAHPLSMGMIASQTVTGA